MMKSRLRHRAANFENFLKFLRYSLLLNFEVYDFETEQYPPRNEKVDLASTLRLVASRIFFNFCTFIFSLSLDFEPP